jgi:hypothetical protein
MTGVVALALALLLAGCAARDFQGSEIAPPPAADRPAGAGRPTFVEAPAGRAAPRIELDYGSGDCAPVLRDGTRGTCIDNRPCNGFGFKDPQGRIVCACYEVSGGCPADSVCSIRRRACVRQPDDLQRAPAR